MMFHGRHICDRCGETFGAVGWRGQPVERDLRFLNFDICRTCAGEIVLKEQESGARRQTK
jgi:hypothetical protein